MSELRHEMCELEWWRHIQHPVLSYLANDGGAIHIQSDVVVRDADLRIVATGFGHNLG